jgi:hypothetical protein
VLYLFVVTTCKCSVNLLTNPNPACSLYSSPYRLTNLEETRLCNPFQKLPLLFSRLTEEMTSRFHTAKPLTINPSFISKSQCLRAPASEGVINNVICKNPRYEEFQLNVREGGRSRPLSPGVGGRLSEQTVEPQTANENTSDQFSAVTSHCSRDITL